MTLVGGLLHNELFVSGQNVRIYEVGKNSLDIC